LISANLSHFAPEHDIRAVPNESWFQRYGRRIRFAAARTETMHALKALSIVLHSDVNPVGVQAGGIERLKKVLIEFA
jgi:hypothetical protein